MRGCSRFLSGYDVIASLGTVDSPYEVCARCYSEGESWFALPDEESVVDLRR